MIQRLGNVKAGLENPLAAQRRDLLGAITERSQYLVGMLA
jgi:hypothetical protein